MVLGLKPSRFRLLADAGWGQELPSVFCPLHFSSTQGRAQYKWWEFMKHHNLSKPEAATFFYAYHDEHAKAHHQMILKLEKEPIFS